MAKLPVDENFFKGWTPEMSYILGFVVADGSICKRKDRKDSYYLNITNKDLLHLKKIKKAMKSHHKIGPKTSGFTKKKDNYYFQISNKQVCKDLLNLGILPRKTYNLNPIKVSDEYFPDFIRGFFDGDGTVYVYTVNKTPQIKASFIGYSLPFIEDLNQHLCKSLNIPLKTIHQEPPTRKDQNLPRYTINFYVDDCEKLAKFMYRNSPTLYLPRKRRVFEKWKLIKRRHYIKQNYPSKIGWHLNQKVFA